MADLLNKYDIMVKDEGSFKALFFKSKKAQNWAKKNNIRNDSMNPAENWKVDVTLGQAKKLVKVLESEKFKVLDF